MFKKILLLALILSLFLSSFGLVDAVARGPRSNLNWPPSPAIEPTILTVEHPAGSGNFYFRDDVDTPMVIQYFFEWIIVLGGLATFIAFIWAGLLYMSSVGDANKITEARKKMKNALLGLVLLMSSYLIFYTINPELTRLEVIDPRINAVAAGFTTEIQEKIRPFIQVYSACVVYGRMRERLTIRIDLPWPLPTFHKSLVDLLGLAPRFDYPLYTSFIPGQTARNCGGLRNLIIGYRDIPDNFPYGVRPLGAENYRDLINALKLPGHRPMNEPPNIPW